LSKTEEQTLVHDASHQRAPKAVSRHPEECVAYCSCQTVVKICHIRTYFVVTISHLNSSVLGLGPYFCFNQYYNCLVFYVLLLTSTVTGKMLML